MSVKCPKCGNEVNEDTKVCPHCGSSISDEKTCTCVNCGEEVDKFFQYCPYCGKKPNIKLSTTNSTNNYYRRGYVTNLYGGGVGFALGFFSWIGYMYSPIV